MSRILITGGTGCIGASTIDQLLSNSSIERIVVVSRSGNPKLLQLWQGETLDSRIDLVNGDISDGEALGKLIANENPTHLVHLGALQSPACAADPDLGMQVNTGGVLSILAAARELPDLQRFVFASSGAVYGKRAEYDMPTIPESVALYPPNLYGVWKLAGEGLVQLFHEQTGVPSVSLRLNTTYGPGRDLGKTSAVTTAMKSIGLGHSTGKSIPFRMPYHGRENYHYVSDVGAHFAAVTTEPFSGCEAFNIRGQTIQVSEFLQAMREVAKELGMGDTVDVQLVENPDENLFICDLDDAKVQNAFPGLPCTDIKDGIRKSLNKFGEMARQGGLSL